MTHGISVCVIADSHDARRTTQKLSSPIRVSPTLMLQCQPVRFTTAAEINHKALRGRPEWDAYIIVAEHLDLISGQPGSTKLMVESLFDLGIANASFARPIIILSEPTMSDRETTELLRLKVWTVVDRTTALWSDESSVLQDNLKAWAFLQEEGEQIALQNEEALAQLTGYYHRIRAEVEKQIPLPAFVAFQKTGDVWSPNPVHMDQSYLAIMAELNWQRHGFFICQFD